MATSGGSKTNNKKRKAESDTVISEGSNKKARRHGRRTSTSAEDLQQDGTAEHATMPEANQGLSQKRVSSSKKTKSAKEGVKDVKDVKAKRMLAKQAKRDAKKQKRKEQNALKKRERKQEDASNHPNIGSTKGVEAPNSEQAANPRKERAKMKKARRAATRIADGKNTEAVLQSTSTQLKAQREYPDWTVSNPSAGRFLNQDPVFVRDQNGDDFLISANEREIQVLSLQTSLVYRVRPSIMGSIVCYFVDSLNNFVYICCNDRTIRCWDWTTDEEADVLLSTEGRPIALTVSRPAGKGRAALLYISFVGKNHAIFCQKDSILLYTTKQVLRHIQVVGNGEYIVCLGPATVVLGMRKDQAASATDYIWVEVPLAITATCCDGRVVASPQTDKKKGKRAPGLQLAIATQNGEIHLYDDVSTLFRDVPNARLPGPRILHWHREAVSSVKFSQDGNYLISGGKETVLVIWQLDTGIKQFLPHLTSEIERIVVNPEGDRYAVQMGDNSIIVLSTSELKPVAHYAGLQVAPPSMLNNNENNLSERTIAASLHPRHSNRLLISVPSSRPKALGDITTRPFLQTFDTIRSRHISRQALTRNNVTDFNRGPENTPILPPDVVHLAISHDGSWLATVDEWMPPVSDLSYLHTNGSEIERERRKRCEVYLKIWHWDEEQSLWTLSTRVDSPHTHEHRGTGAGKVLAMVAHPTKLGFATAGEDMLVKLWTPRKQKLDATKVEWICKHVVHMPGTMDLDLAETLRPPVVSVQACLSYSNDGSLLAVTQSRTTASIVSQDGPMVYFIDPATGSIVVSKPNMAKDEIYALGFLERYFIAVSHRTAYIWDLVEDRVLYTITLSSARRHEPATKSLLAINPEDDTFALVMDNKRVEVYKPPHNACIYKHEFERKLDGILSRSNLSGFLLVFDDATLRTISPVGTASSQMRMLLSGEYGFVPSASTPGMIDAEKPEKEVEEEAVGISASTNGLLVGREVVSLEREAYEEDDRPVVRPEQLATIFDIGHGSAVPPVRDMFQAVVGLFGRKPLQAISA